MKTLKILKFEELSSTNEFANEYLQSISDNELTFIWALNQTKGKGQGKNSWESEKNKNLTFSIVYQAENIAVENNFLISKSAALSIVDFLTDINIGAKIKWPNDIYVKDKKLGGILIENRIKGAFITTTIIGIGLNVFQVYFSDKLPNPTSICLEQKEFSYDLEKLLDRFTQYFFKRMDDLEEMRFQKISDSYHKSLYRKKGFYTYRDAQGIFEAELVEVKNSGELLLKDTSGKLRSYFFKEVEFII